jgi:hypothetical protein
MLTGTLVTVAGFVPIGFARSAAGEYTFSIFAVVAIALQLLRLPDISKIDIIGAQEVYDRFTEGFDAADLEMAKALLDALQ